MVKLSLFIIHSTRLSIHISVKQAIVLRATSRLFPTRRTVVVTGTCQIFGQQTTTEPQTELQDSSIWSATDAHRINVWRQSLYESQITTYHSCFSATDKSQIARDDWGIVERRVNKSEEMTHTSRSYHENYESNEQVTFLLGMDCTLSAIPLADYP